MSGEEGRNERPRGAQDMQALLHFCTDLTIADDTTGPSQQSQLDPERREFLSHVLSDMQDNVVRRMSACLAQLTKDAVMNTEDDTEEQEVALENLAEYCDDIDNAVDLQKIGGFPIVVNCLDSPHSTLRAAAASLIAVVCQNCEHCQKSMLELNIFTKLLHMLDNDSSEQAKIKSLYAISCLVRECKEAEDSFLSLDGLSYLMRSMQTNIEKLVIKSCFLLSHLLSQNPTCSESVVSMGYVEQMINIFSNDETSDVTHEHCCRVLYNLAGSAPSVLEECLRPELGLIPVLKLRLTKIKGLEENMDEEEVINQLLALFSDSEATDDSLNR